METFDKLSPDTKNAVTELVEINADSRKGFKKARDLVGEPELVRLFEAMANLREEQALELAKFGAMKDPLQSSFSGKLHRWWMDLRSAVAKDEALAVLEEVERGEDEIKGRYEKLLKQNPGTPLSSLLHAQYRAVKSGHDRIRDLRDRLREAS